MVKEYHEKLTNLRGIAKEEHQKSIHLADIGIGKRVLYGFEYLNLIQSSTSETHLLTERLMSDCGQWPDLADYLDATALFGRDFGEVLSPSQNSRVCHSFQQLPIGKDYLATDARIIQKLLQRNSCATTPWRLTSTDLVWMAVQNPFQTCKRKTANSHIRCSSCNPIQQLKKGSNVRNAIERDSLPALDTGALIFGYKSNQLRKKLEVGSQHDPKQIDGVVELPGNTLDFEEALVRSSAGDPRLIAIDSPAPSIEQPGVETSNGNRSLWAAISRYWGGPGQQAAWSRKRQRT